MHASIQPIFQKPRYAIQFKNDGSHVVVTGTQEQWEDFTTKSLHYLNDDSSSRSLFSYYMENEDGYFTTLTLEKHHDSTAGDDDMSITFTIERAWEDDVVISTTLYDMNRTMNLLDKRITENHNVINDTIATLHKNII